MAARRAERWIIDAVRSVLDQRFGGEIVLMVGVDDCPRTSAALTARGVRHFRSAEHRGPYVVRNSLIIACPPRVSHYVVFDADDVMDLDYVERLTEAAGEDGLSGCARRIWRDEDGPIPADAAGLRTAPFDTGRPTISASAWARLGGFASYLVSADTDLWWRARDMGLPLRTLEAAHFTARLHPGSQMAAPETCLTSPLRAGIFARIYEGLRAGRLTVEAPETVALEEAA
jgi:hypothetical protein